VLFSPLSGCHRSSRGLHRCHATSGNSLSEVADSDLRWQMTTCSHTTCVYHRSTVWLSEFKYVNVVFANFQA